MERSHLDIQRHQQKDDKGDREQTHGKKFRDQVARFITEPEPGIIAYSSQELQRIASVNKFKIEKRTERDR